MAVIHVLRHSMGTRAPASHGSYGGIGDSGTSPFFRAYAGSGLVIQRLARFQRTWDRARVARTVSPLTRPVVSTSAYAVWAARSQVHRLVGWPKSRGPRWSRSVSR